MKKLTYAILAIIAVYVVSACGSSGGNAATEKELIEEEVESVRQTYDSNIEYAKIELGYANPVFFWMPEQVTKPEWSVDLGYMFEIASDVPSECEYTYLFSEELFTYAYSHNVLYEEEIGVVTNGHCGNIWEAYYINTLHTINKNGNITAHPAASDLWIYDGEQNVDLISISTTCSTSEVDVNIRIDENNAFDALYDWDFELCPMKGTVTEQSTLITPAIVNTGNPDYIVRAYAE